MESVFRFKQFEVEQGGCAMKINTDGVLLGAWTRSVGVLRILDMGTGTGVIAMMLAQAHPNALVDAVEIDRAAAKQAAGNFARSPFRERLRVFERSFVDFRSERPYDLIVSNPPFHTHSLHSPDEHRNVAKHADSSFFEQLFAFVSDFLADGGIFSCIVPASLADRLARENLPERNGLFCQTVLNVSSYPDRPAIRKIVSFGKERTSVSQRDLSIYAGPGVHSPDYKACLAPYFLAY